MKALLAMQILFFLTYGAISEVAIYDKVRKAKQEAMLETEINMLCSMPLKALADMPIDPWSI